MVVNTFLLVFLVRLDGKGFLVKWELMTWHLHLVLIKNRKFIINFFDVLHLGFVIDTFVLLGAHGNKTDKLTNFLLSVNFTAVVILDFTEHAAP
jgi:hypothetical protein